MCEPATIALAVSAAAAMASTAASLKAQSDQAGAAEDTQARQIAASLKQMDQNRTLATDSFLSQSYQTARNLSQQRAAATDQSIKMSIKTKQAAGTAAAVAASHGVEGIGVQSLLDDFKRQEAMFNANLKTNVDFKTEATRARMDELSGQYSGRIASVQPFIPQPIAQPNYFGTISGMVGTMASSYSSLKVPTGTPVTPAGSGFGAGSDAFNKTVSMPDYSGGAEF